MRSRNKFLMVAVAIVAALMAADVMAQPGGGGRGGRGGRGGGGFGGFGGGGGSMTTTLLGVEAVREEIEMSDEQWADAKKVMDESRGERGERGERPNFREMSEEERNEYMEKRQKEAEDRDKKLRESLEDIILDHQFERLDEIELQVLGIAALQKTTVRKELKISEEQEGDLKKKSEEQQGKMRDKIRELFSSARDGGGGFDRDEMRKKFTEMRSDMEKDVLSALSESQRKDFEKMKGEKFEMPEGAMRGGRGGRGGGQGRGDRGGRGGRGGGDRPARPE